MKEACVTVDKEGDSLEDLTFVFRHVLLLLCQSIKITEKDVLESSSFTPF